MIVPCLLSANTSGSPPASCVSTNTGLSNPIAGPSATAADGTNTPKTASRLAATMLKRMAPTPLPRDGTRDLLEVRVRRLPVERLRELSAGRASHQGCLVCFGARAARIEVQDE